MSIGRAQFIYSVPQTPWHVIVTDQSKHFYFNSSTKKSVWQITETEPGLELKLDYNELAVLFAKARGFGGETRLEREERVKQETEKRFEQTESIGKSIDEEAKGEEDFDEQKLDEDAEDLEDAEESEKETNVEDPYALIQAVVEEKGGVEEKDELADDVEKSAGIGALQGYLSSEEEEEKESEKEEGVDEIEAEDPLNLDLNDDTMNDDPVAAFKELLSQHQDKFSRYDPWFIVSEELVSELAQEPAFYSLSDADKERVYDEWVRETEKEELSGLGGLSGIYPSPTLRFYQELQEHKSDLRKLPYREFVEKFSVTNVGLDEPEKVYRKLRATLVEFAEYEKQAKKSGQSQGQNLKVKRVADFVQEELKLGEYEKRDVEIAQEASFFDQWVALCNAFELPPEMVESPINFILGDEKRLGCYKTALLKKNS
uniref:WW domain-containing protein n=1 Tax=Candidozyma auris TaxID=498019 RepID=A0A0L0NST3_CANAR